MTTVPTYCIENLPVLTSGLAKKISDSGIALRPGVSASIDIS
jgi:hypothetical protein